MPRCASTDLFSQVEKVPTQSLAAAAEAASALSRVGGVSLFLKQTNQVDEKLLDYGAKKNT